MAQVYNRLTLDVKKKNHDIITAVQNDAASRYLDINLIDNGVNINLTGHEVRLYARKPDQTEVYNDGEITNAEQGRVQIELTSQLLAKEGYIEAQVIVFKNNTEILSTLNFKIMVVKSLMSENAVPSSNEYGALIVLYQNLYEAHALMTKMIKDIGTPGPKALENNLDTMFEVWDYLINYLESNSSAGVIEKIGKPGDAGPNTLFGAIKTAATAKVQIITTPNRSVTMRQGNIVKTAQASSLGVAEFELGLGFWDIQAEKNYKALIEQTGRLYTITSADKLSLNECSWGLIDLLGKQGLANQYFSIGDTKDIAINGEVVTCQLAAFEHDNLQGGGKAKMTFLLKNGYTTRGINETSINTTSWRDSKMRTTHIPAIKKDIPEDLKTVVKTVIKRTATSGATSTIISTNDDFWLPSAAEIFGTSATSHAYSGEGSPYPIFTDTQSRIKKNGNTGSPNNWWTRSPSHQPSSNNTLYFVCVYAGGAIGYGNSSAGFGVVFGFCV